MLTMKGISGTAQRYILFSDFPNLIFEYLMFKIRVKFSSKHFKKLA